MPEPTRGALPVQLSDWAKFGNWLHVLPPNRPDRANTDQLIALISGLGRRQRACVLGSTPEYRAVLREQFDEVHIIERSPEFKRVSDQMVGVAPNEFVHFGDWLTELPFHERQFDLIASHFTHGNITFDDRARFFSLIGAALSKAGRFFDTVFNPAPRLYSLFEVRDMFAGAPVNLRTLNDINCVAIFRGELIRTIGHVDSTATYGWLMGEGASTDFKRLVDLTFELITPMGLEWHYHPDRPYSSLDYEVDMRVLSCSRGGDSTAYAGCIETLVSRGQQRG